jgi:hypothetical protein
VDSERLHAEKINRKGTQRTQRKILKKFTNPALSLAALLNFH